MYRLRALPTLIPKIGAGGGNLKNGLWVAKLFYFFFFAAIGCLVPYLNVYFAQHGLSGAQIGWLGSIAPLIALTSNPLWATIADRWQLHRQVLSLCAVGAGLISFFYLAVDTFWPLMVVTVVLTFFRTPIGSLLDSAALDMVRRVGGHYGRQRVWGSFGFVLITLGLSQIISISDLGLLFWIHGLLLTVACGGLAFALPIGSKATAVSLGAGLKQLASQPGYLSFLGAMALLGIGTSTFVNFIGLHILEVGGDQQWLALAWSVNAIAEIPVMLLGGRWFARFRYSRLIQIGLAGYMVVWALMAFATVPWFLIVLAFANGICYGTVWVSAVNYAGESAPPGLSATAQALIGAAQSGIGWSIGAVLAGYLWDAAGGGAAFAMASCAALAAGTLFWLGNRRTSAGAVTG